MTPLFTFITGALPASDCFDFDCLFRASTLPVDPSSRAGWGVVQLVNNNALRRAPSLFRVMANNWQVGSSKAEPDKETYQNQ